MDPGSLGGLLALVPLLALWAWCLVDVVRADAWAVRTLTREQWLWVVALLNVLGAVMWLAMGRPPDRR